MAGDETHLPAMPVAAMREVDRRAIEEFGIPGVVLMENAGRGAAGVALAMLSRESSPSVLVIAGRGNNGGDGYVVARHLHNAGVEVSVRVLAPFDSITGDARVNLDIIRRMQLDVREMNIPEERETLAREIASASLVVDAMLGTGTKGEVRDPFRTAIELVNASKKPVLAVDIPSGLDGDSGVALGACIVATETVTFARAKTGLVQLSAQRYVGRITVVDIGVPREILESPSDPPRK